MKNSILKKFILLILAAVLATALAGCGSESGTNPPVNDPDGGIEDAEGNSAGTEGSQDDAQPEPKTLTANSDGLYMIYTAEDLVLYRDMFDEAAQSFRDKSSPSDTFIFPGLILMNDIDLSSVCNAEKGSWKPIGRDAYYVERTEKYSDESFFGTFDGNGKTISGLYIDDAEEGGALIQCLWEGTVKDLTVTNSSLKGSYCAVITYETRDGLIENCVIADSVTIEGEKGAAGFIIKAQNWNCSCAVQYCKNYATVKTSGIGGGFICSASKGVYVIGCENHGDITSYGDGADYLGGIVGYHSGSSSYAGCVYGCINYGDVTDPITTKAIGVSGIVGKSNTTIEYCVNAGNISAAKSAYDITHYDSGARHYNCNYGTVACELEQQYAISAVYKKSSYKGLNYPIGTPALTDGTALAEIIANSGNFWKQGEKFPVWNGEFRKDFPNIQTSGIIVQ